jgi:hypothetical protein
LPAALITWTWNTFSAAVLRPSHLPIRRSTVSRHDYHIFRLVTEPQP